MDWLEIFKTGRHTDSAGQTRDWTADDLATIARQYDPAHHEAPIVLGHPAHDAPAYGWIEALKVEGDRLLAKPKQLAEELTQWVRDGKYKKVSIALYPDLTLRHLGFLGAQPPAVKGLAQAAFGERADWIHMDDWQQGTVQGMFRRLREWLIEHAGIPAADRVLPGYEIDALAPAPAVDAGDAGPGDTPEADTSQLALAEKGETEMREFLEKLRALIHRAEAAAPDPPPAGFSEADVQAREQAAVAKALTEAEGKAARDRRVAEAKGKVLAFVEAGVQAGTFLPAWREAGVPAVIEQALLVETPLQFADGQPAKNPGEILLGFFENLPKIVPLGEHAPGGAADPEAALKAAYAEHAALHAQLGVTFEMFKARTAQGA
jgi:hypothetical protein